MAQCPCPITIKDPRSKSNAQRITVPCGKCPVCLQNKRAEWSFRLLEELRTATSAYFLTLTYEDEKCPDNFSLDKRAIQLFNKRLRKAINTYEAQVSKKIDNRLEALKMRFYAVGEYGSKTSRPHYHGIYFNVPQKVMYDLDKIWQNGITHYGKVTAASIHYTCKYVIQRYDQKDDREQPFALMSRRPGIGHGYLKRNDAWHVHNLAPYVLNQGFKQRMPGYYKNAIFTESEKDKMKEHFEMVQNNKWIQDYDKEYRKTEIDFIQDQFRKIMKQSKSN